MLHGGGHVVLDSPPGVLDRSGRSAIVWGPDRRGKDHGRSIVSQQLSDEHGTNPLRPSRQNEAILRNFSRALLPALAIILLLLAAIVVASFWSIAYGAKGVDVLWGQMLSIHLVQIGAGMLLGMLCLF